MPDRWMHPFYIFQGTAKRPVGNDGLFFALDFIKKEQIP